MRAVIRSIRNRVHSEFLLTQLIIQMSVSEASCIQPPPLIYQKTVSLIQFLREFLTLIIKGDFG